MLKLKAIHTPIQHQLETMPQKNYYMVLFSFHVRRGNFKEASFWMFVLAVKIREHIRYDVIAKDVYDNPQEREKLCDKLQCMSDAYASSVSTLQLVSKDHQWHTEPRKASSAAAGATAEHSSKRSRTGGGGASGRTARSLAAGVDVVTLAALKRQLLLARSELELARYGGSAPSHGAVIFAESGGEQESVRETVLRLVDMSMFDSAMSLSIAYRALFAAAVDQASPEEDIYVALVDKCVLATEEDVAEGGWLGKNDLNPVTGSRGGDVYVVDPNLQGVKGAAWEFLRRFLTRHEPPPDAKYASEHNYAFHRCVADRILSFASSNGGSDSGGDAVDASQHVQLPVWLVENFKKRHGAALLDLYVNHKQFDDAIELVRCFVKDLVDTKKRIADAGDGDDLIEPVLLPYEAIKRLEAELAVVSRTNDIDFVHKY